MQTLRFIGRFPYLFQREAHDQMFRLRLLAGREPGRRYTGDPCVSC